MVILFCLGCAKAAHRDHVPATAFKVVDEATLTALNDAQLDLRAAQELAFNPAPPAVTVGDKVTNMGKALASSTCVHGDGKQIEPPALPDFSKKWDFLWYVENDGKAICPATVKHSLDFKIDDKDPTANQLAIIRSFQATASEFRKLNSFWYMATEGDPAVGGLIAAKKVPGGRQVTGHIGLILRFEGIAQDVHVSIDLVNNVRGTTATGYGAVIVRIGPATSLGTVSWNTREPSPITYVLNGKSITEKDFQSLFSALGVLELIDYAKKM